MHQAHQRKKKEYEVFAELFPEEIEEPVKKACDEQGVSGQKRLPVRTKVVQEMWKTATNEQKLAVWKYQEEAKKELDHQVDEYLAYQILHVVHLQLPKIVAPWKMRVRLDGIVQQNIEIVQLL